MQWNKKYNYPSSTRSIINHSRMYSLNNQIFPSVTSILQMTKSESEKASLKAWSERVGFKESLRIKNEAAQRGTQMHSLIENFLLMLIAPSLLVYFVQTTVCLKRNFYLHCLKQNYLTQYFCIQINFFSNNKN